jgi:hypothetical protein
VRFPAKEASPHCIPKDHLIAQADAAEDKTVLRPK